MCSSDLVRVLLARGAAMAMAVERWSNKGLWILCISDDGFPQGLKQHLKHQTPPILYGVGDQSVLSMGGVAVVGSRNADQAAEEFARALAFSVAGAGLPLVSGGARGVDEVAMLAALEKGGTVLGVLCDNLMRVAVSGKFRESVRNGLLTLVSTSNPESGFSVGNAMGRNKLIYAFADYGVVVSSAYNEGGTWAGANEELRRSGGRPVFVRSGDGVPKGNRELLLLGARAFPLNALKTNLVEALRTATANSPSSHDSQPTLFDMEPSPVAGTAPEVTPPPPAKPDATGASQGYEAVKRSILEELSEPRKLKELGQSLKVSKEQLQNCINRLLEEGAIEERKVGRAKKLVIREPDGELPFR